LADDSLQFVDKDQQESCAVARKPRICCCCKIQYTSKFTVALHGSSFGWWQCFLVFTWHDQSIVDSWL